MNPIDAEARRFISRSLIARIATVTKAGRPQIMPLWFFIDDDGSILMSNSSTSAAVRSIGHHPDVQLLFLADRDPDDTRCLRANGTAVFEPGVSLRKNIVVGSRRYYFSMGALRSTMRNLGRLPRFVPAFVRYGSERSGHVGYIRVRLDSYEFLAPPPPAPSPVP